MQNIVLSEKPAITTTIASLPPALLEQLLSELSTLASVYHKPPESFVGKGRFGADELQQAAIREQRQNAAENPIAAAVGTSSTNGQQQNNVENLLDIDFDGAAPASQEDGNGSGNGGATGGGMADMMGLFDAPAPSQAAAPAQTTSPPPAAGPSGGGMDDLMNGFGGLQFGGGASEPAPAGTQLHGGGAQAQGQAPAQKKDSEDLLGLF